MFYIINVCCVYSLKSPHRVHTTYICKIREENLSKLSVYRIWRKSLRTQERVRLIHSKRAIGVRAIEVLLYVTPPSKTQRERKTRLSNGTTIKTLQSESQRDIYLPENWSNGYQEKKKKKEKFHQDIHAKPYTTKNSKP